ncbi:MAG TPA: peptidyl-prolyl cis-trans isomerase [bacterium]
MTALPPFVHSIARLGCAVLLIAAALPLVAIAAPPPATDNPVVAKVGNWDIHASDLRQYSESLPAGAGNPSQPDEHRYLSLAVREEVLFQWTIGGPFRGDRTLRDKLKATVFQHIVETQVRPKVRVTNAEIRKYYEDNLDLVRGGHVRARRISLAKASACDTLRQEIDSETAFIDAAVRLSQDRTTAATGGDLGYVLPTNGPLGYEKRLFTMRPGEMRVFKGDKGCDLVRLVEKTDPPIPALNEVRESLRGYLESQQQERYLDDLVTEARKTVKVRLYLKRPASLSSRQSVKH